MKVHDNKEAINNIFDSDTPYNEFYHSVSVIFRAISFLLFAAFLFFIVSSAFAGAENFSYDNLEYIVRNFALKLDENRDASRYAIRYNPDAYRSYSIFGEGLAVCGTAQLSIYSATGRLTCSESMAYSDPIMTASDKFALVYENGSGRYTLYNSFTAVFSAELPYDIKGAAISNNGSYALITSSDSYNSVVEVYNSDFQKVNSINRTDYVTCVDISDTHVLVSSVDVDESNSYKTSVLLCKIGSNRADFNIASDSSIPMGCAVYESGCTLVSADRAEFFNIDGSVRSEYDFDSERLVSFKFDESGVLLLFKGVDFNTEYSAICLTNDGNINYQKNISSTVFDIEYKNGISYITMENKIMCFDKNNMYDYDISALDSNIKVVAYGDYSAYICTNTAAYPVNFLNN